MRKIFAAFLILGLFSFSIQAQIEIGNGNFEEWTTFTGYEDPTGWDTPNTETSAGSVYVAGKTSDAYEGNYAAWVETKLVFMTLVAPGVLVNGNFAYDLMSADISITGGEPFVDRPEKFTGYYKYTPASGDSCYIIAALFKYNTGTSQRDTVGYAQFYENETVTDWTMFEVDFEYNTGETPDSLMIIVVSSDYENPQEGSVLMVDDLQVTGGTIDIDEVYEPIEVNIFPNPVVNEVNIELNSGQSGALKIFNVIGKEIYKGSIAGNSSVKIDVADLPQGIYFVEIQTASQKFTRKIFKN